MPAYVWVCLVVAGVILFLWLAVVIDGAVHANGAMKQAYEEQAREDEDCHDRPEFDDV